MSEQATAPAESSPALAAPAEQAPKLEVPRSGTDEYAEWRVSGKLPEKITPKTEESAPSDREKASTSAPGESETPQQQDRTKPKTEKRFQDLLSERNALKAELAAYKSKPAQAEPTPAPQPEAKKSSKPTLEDKNDDGSYKYGSYEDLLEALAEHKVTEREAAKEQRDREEAQRKQVETKVADAKTRYDHFDEIAAPFTKLLVEAKDIPVAVKQMVGESDVWPDLIFTLGSNPEARDKFLQMAKTEPGKALRYVAKVEALIEAGLSSGKATTPRGENGQFTSPASAPAKRGPESAPAPPLEVGNRGAGTMDASERALAEVKRGNKNAFAAWKEAEDAKELRRRRGAA
jgi:hypothetical protein